MVSQTLKTYYWLTKPGIIYGNALAAAGGFLLASWGMVDIGLFVATLVGMSLAMASACVLNNYIDRGIDAKMARTKKRALVTGTVSAQAAVIYAVALGVAGTTILWIFTNPLVVAVGLGGGFAYLVLYGIAKRRSIHGTLVGTLSGAAPLIGGYVAVTGQFDLAALLLFIIMVVWQMPHFYAIAIFRSADYKAAGIPVWPLKKGVLSTKRYMVFYIVMFIAASSLLTLFGFTGYIYLAVMMLVGLWWLRLGIMGWQTTDDVVWARRLFGFSLIVLLTFCVMISADALLL